MSAVKQSVCVIELDTSTGTFTIRTDDNFDQPSTAITSATLCSQCREPLLQVTGRLIGCSDFCGHWIHINCIPQKEASSKDEEFDEDSFLCRDCGSDPSPIDLAWINKFIVVEKNRDTS
jgi:hypothetical protein